MNQELIGEPYVRDLDYRIKDYAKDVLEATFEGLDGNIRITKDDKEAAMEILETIAKFEIYHKAIIQRNPDTTYVLRNK